MSVADRVREILREQRCGGVGERVADLVAAIEAAPSIQGYYVQEAWQRLVEGSLD